MKIFLRIVAVLLGISLLTYFAGPQPKDPALNAQVPVLSEDLRSLETSIRDREAVNPAVKPGCEAAIVWLDSLNPAKTPYSVVYVHGFSASHVEGSDLAKEFARRYGCNLYLARLQAHGLDRPEPMLEMTADSLYQSAVDALAVGKKIGEKVILISTSTGGTLSLEMAANLPGSVDGLILYSPNIQIFGSTAAMLARPWGLQMARAVTGGNYRGWDGSEYEQKYWTTRYRLEAVVELQNLVENSMKPETFAKVTQPVMLGYYYQDEIHQDSTVSVAAMLNMYEQLGTPETQKRKVAFAGARAHVIANPVISKAFDNVKMESFRFAEEILGFRPR